MKWLLILITVSLLSSCGQKYSNSNTEAESQTEETVEALKLPGLAPVDIYLNLEKQGFVTEKSLGGEYGNSWICKSSNGGIDYEVSIFSSGTMDVESVTATAMNSDGEYMNSLPFLQFVASSPIEGVDREAVQKFVSDFIVYDKKEFVSGEVRYELLAPTKFVRMLKIMHKDRRG